ncbi:MAG: L-fucose isomerase [Clostridia bacterium]|nr:L-fucose isomerase [Clostridia bacterium]
MKTISDGKGSTMTKIGIRPTIDGRERGVREALEVQTMDMAKSAAALISSSLKDREGNAVECVIADTTIGGVVEAAQCADKFAREGVCATLTVTPCWCYGSETMDMDPMLPKAVWGFNGTERPGAVYLAAVLAAHSQKGLPAFGIYGHDVQDSDDTSIPQDVKEKILRFAGAAVAVGQMKGKSYLSCGSVSMGIAGSMVEPSFFEDYLGMRCEQVDMTEYVRRIEEEIYDKDEFDKALSWVKQNCKEGKDINKQPSSRERKDYEWEFTIKCALIAKDLMGGNDKLKEMGFNEEGMGHNAIAGGFQGQRQWTDHFPNADFVEAMLCSSFDWNGKRAPYVFATENDALNGTAMLFGQLLTNSASIFSDVRTYWSPEAVKRVTGKDLPEDGKNGVIHLINSGATCLDGTGQQEKNGQPAMKPFWDITDEEVEKCLDATDWCQADKEYFRGGGYSSHFKTKGKMPVTMSRVNLVKGLGPVLQIAEGYTVDLPDDINDVLEARTSPTWPTTWFAPRLTGQGAFTDVYSVMANWGANHGAISYGHIGADLISLAAMLRIPVNMHNVEQGKIFRPSSWNAFGTQNKESADYMACKNFGPIYG